MVAYYKHLLSLNCYMFQGGDWHNPIAPAGKERETCPFFAKVGACRFGER